jgi:glycosyltransferase involved in cell wall biosynthesis
LIRANSIQVINIHYPIDLFIYFGVLRWFMPLKLVVSLHGADIFPGGQQRKHYSWPLQFLLRSADAVVGPSKAFLNDCISVFPFLTSKGVFIHNGIDIDELKRQDGETAVAEKRQYLLCIAEHNQKKAIDVLLKAFAEVSRLHPTLKLCLVGDGPQRSENEDLANSLSLHDRVEFLGHCPRRKVAALLYGCRVFVLPSRSEPFGIVVAEALACRKPVVASAVGGIPEIIENGESGVLVEPDNPEALARALLAVLEDKDRRETMAAAGHARVLGLFRYQKAGGRYETLYSRVIGGISPVTR